MTARITRRVGVRFPAAMLIALALSMAWKRASFLALIEWDH